MRNQLPKQKAPTLPFIYYDNGKEKGLKVAAVLPNVTKDTVSTMNQTPTHSIKILTKGRL